MMLPLSRFAPSPSLSHCCATREGDAPSAAGRPLRGGTGLGCASFKGLRVAHGAMDN